MHMHFYLFSEILRAITGEKRYYLHLSNKPVASLPDAWRSLQTLGKIQTRNELDVAHE